MTTSGIITETVTRRKDVRFYFHPICPWTWLTSRWLVEVAQQRDLRIDWRVLSLSVLNGGIDAMPEQSRAGAGFSQHAQRVMVAMTEAGRNDQVDDLYTALGTGLFIMQSLPDRRMLEGAAAVSEATGFLDAADDPSRDRWIEASTREAMDLAGPDVGSPVLAFRGEDRGFFGPIVSPVPTGEEPLRIWDALLTVIDLPSFFELKRGRSGAPDLRPADLAVVAAQR